MNITSVEEKKGVRESGINRLWQRTYTRVWIVQTDDPAVDALTVRTAPGIPQVGNSYSVSAAVKDLGSFVESVEARETHEDGRQWEVTVKYGPYDANLFPADPTEWPIKLTWGADSYERVVYVDRNGNPIANTAGDPFADPITVDDSRPVLTVVRNELVSAFSPLLADQYRDTINLNPWNGAAAGTVKCKAITTSEPQYDSDAQVWYYAVTYVFEYNRDGWAKKILDQGYGQLDGGSPPKVQKILGSDKQPPDEPQLLDGSGHLLAHGGTPVVLTFDVYPVTDFAAFNLNFSTAIGFV